LGKELDFNGVGAVFTGKGIKTAKIYFNTITGENYAMLGFLYRKVVKNDYGMWRLV
jgi:hypothetical protein